MLPGKWQSFCLGVNVLTSAWDHACVWVKVLPVNRQVSINLMISAVLWPGACITSHFCRNNAKFMEIHFLFHTNSNEMITTKFCIWHESNAKKLECHIGQDMNYNKMNLPSNLNFSENIFSDTGPRSCHFLLLGVVGLYQICITTPKSTWNIQQVGNFVECNLGGLNIFVLKLVLNNSWSTSEIRLYVCQT